MESCEICKEEIKPGEQAIHKYGYAFHRENCWKQFKKGLRKSRKDVKII